MHTMILAAGRGERMRPLTDRCPKPLLKVGGQALIVWHLQRLASAGLRDIVINHAWLGEQLIEHLGDGRRWGVTLHYSAETTALETAGGIAQALPLLGDAPFLVLNGDIWCDWDVRRAPDIAAVMKARNWWSWSILVDNPPHHPRGDFTLEGERLGLPHDPRAATLTFSGIGIYDPRLLAEITPGAAAPLAPLLRAAAAAGRAGAEHHTGQWVDVGTPQRLAELQAQWQHLTPPRTHPNS
jgi:MurNAc alpha-1-phosphate uridylyltransferase